MDRRLVIDCGLVLIICSVFFFGILPFIAGKAAGEAGETMLLGVLFASDNGNEEVAGISPEDAAEGVAEGRFDVILDVRQPAEYKEMHIPGAVLIPLDRLKDEAQTRLNSPDKPVLTYCAVGGRSLQAARVLMDMGYTHVFNLEGGIIAWKEKGLPVVK